MTFKVVLFNDSEVRFGYTRSAGCYELATILRKEGYETLVVNYSFAITFEKFKKIIDLTVDSDTVVVGFSANWFDSQTDVFQNKPNWEDKSLSVNFKNKHIQPYIEYIKLKNPNIKTILGGFTAHKYINQSEIDNIFIGYSERQIIDYMNALKNGYPKIPRIIDHDTKGLKYDIKSCDIQYNEYDLLHAEELLSIEVARGCIFKCSFCSFPLIGSKTVDYLKHKDVVYNELLTNYQKWGIKRYFIIDDTFNDSVEKLKSFCEIVESLPFKIEFVAYIRIDLFAAHPEMADLLKRMGLKFALFGLETWNPDTSRIVKKGGSRERKIEAIKIAKESWGDEVTIVTNLIVGLPNDTRESFDNFIEWYEKEGIDYIGFVVTNPLMLSPDDEKDPYKVFLSDIDKRKEHYGYVFNQDEKLNKDIDFHGGKWEKNEKDTGDIRNRDEATALVKEYNDRIYQIQKKKLGSDYNGMFMKTMGFQVAGLKEKFNIPYTEPEKIILSVFEIDYYPRLIKMLEDRINND